MRTQTILTLLLLCPTGGAFAQSGFVTSGHTVSNAGGSVSYSVGQLDCAYINDTNGTINEGLQQPFEWFIITGLYDHANNPAIELNLYPNPASNHIVIQVTDFQQPMEYLMYDAQGKAIRSGKISEKETRLSVENLHDAIYFIRIWSENRSASTFKIVKSQ